jgi:hypothetical protein
MISNVIRSKPLLIAAVTVGLLWALCLLTWAASGELGLLQSGKVTELGVCLTDQEYSPVLVVPAQTSDLAICGLVSGTTARTTWFNILQGSTAIAQGNRTVGPGVFFVSDLRWYGPLRPGTYAVEARYGTVPAISAEFEVR